LDFPKNYSALALVLFAGAGCLFGQAPAGLKGGAGAGQVYKIYDQATLDRGKKEFVANCGFCHGPSAKGGEGGPDLLRSELVLDDVDGKAIAPVVLNGRPDKGMPKFSLTGGQVSDIVAFLHEGIRAAAQRDTYKVLNVVTGDAKAGEAWFNGAGNCYKCHSASGDLKGIGARYDPVGLQSRIVMPRGRGRGNSGGDDASALTVTVTLPSGQSFSGKLIRIDDFTVGLTGSDGDYHSFTRNGDVPRVEVHDPLQAHMDLLIKYTDADIHNLTAYLTTLK
jgi:cytochrome c oxidase cbb3-type subunit 3